MSVIPLSMKDAAPPEGLSNYGGGSAPTEPKDENPKLDSIISGAIDGAEKKAEAAPEAKATGPIPKGIDAHIAGAISSSEQVAVERSDFDDCSHYREELREITNQPDVGSALRELLGWDSRFRAGVANGTAMQVADEFAALGFMQPYGGASRFERREKSDPLKDIKEDAPSGVRLDAIIESSIKYHRDGGKVQDTKDFSESADIRSELKKRFPGQSISAVTKHLVSMCRDWLDDPRGTAYRIAATYGMPVTETQHKAVERAQQFNAMQGEMHNYIETFAGMREHFPQFETLRDRMGMVLQDPRFPQAENPMAALARAYHMAQDWWLRDLQTQQNEAALSKARQAQGKPKTGIDAHLARAMSRAAA